ncbi:MAG: HU family DNA-binding protein [Microthrixaceae bacterium]|jgi:DNA-binding protein HU-beta
MNKTELIETIAQRTDLSKKDVQSVLDNFEDIAGDIVAKGKDTLTIPGFLKFEQTHRAARTGRNPQTGETIQVAAANAAKVSAGAKLKARAKSGK